jgi:hypothetical protein
VCMQCMAGAMAAGAGGSGLRAWLVARTPRWLTARRRRATTGALLVAGVVAAGIVAPSP